MTKRELIEALERSSVEDWAPVMVSVHAPVLDSEDIHTATVLTIHTNKRQEILIRLEES